MPLTYFQEPRPPGEIPIAGVTLLDILGEQATVDEACLALVRVRSKLPSAVVMPGDEVRRFRTPPWTWANMSGREGLAVIRSGDVVFLIVTRMN